MAARDHRRRMLAHQEKTKAEQHALPSDPQLKMPLIGEVRRLAEPSLKRGRPRVKKHIQPKLGMS